MIRIVRTFFMTNASSSIHIETDIAYQKAQALLEAQCYFSEFGTRRRRSYQAQDIVVKAMLRAAQEVQSTGKFTGTSNVGFLIP